MDNEQVEFGLKVMPKEQLIDLARTQATQEEALGRHVYAMMLNELCDRYEKEKSN